MYPMDFLVSFKVLGAVTVIVGNRCDEVSTLVQVDENIIVFLLETNIMMFPSLVLLDAYHFDECSLFEESAMVDTTEGSSSVGVGWYCSSLANLVNVFQGYQVLVVGVSFKLKGIMVFHLLFVSGRDECHVFDILSQLDLMKKEMQNPLGVTIVIKMICLSCSRGRLDGEMYNCAPDLCFECIDVPKEVSFVRVLKLSRGARVAGSSWAGNMAYKNENVNVNSLRGLDRGSDDCILFWKNLSLHSVGMWMFASTIGMCYPIQGQRNAYAEVMTAYWVILGITQVLWFLRKLEIRGVTCVTGRKYYTDAVRQIGRKTTTEVHRYNSHTDRVVHYVKDALFYDYGRFVLEIAGHIVSEKGDNPLVLTVVTEHKPKMVKVRVTSMIFKNLAGVRNIVDLRSEVWPMSAALKPQCLMAMVLSFAPPANFLKARLAGFCFVAESNCSVLKIYYCKRADLVRHAPTPEIVNSSVVALCFRAKHCLEFLVSSALGWHLLGIYLYAGFLGSVDRSQVAFGSVVLPAGEMWLTRVVDVLIDIRFSRNDVGGNEIDSYGFGGGITEDGCVWFKWMSVVCVGWGPLGFASNSILRHSGFRGFTVHILMADYKMTTRTGCIFIEFNGLVIGMRGSHLHVGSVDCVMSIVSGVFWCVLCDLGIILVSDNDVVSQEWAAELRISGEIIGHAIVSSTLTTSKRDLLANVIIGNGIKACSFLGDSSMESFGFFGPRLVEFVQNLNLFDDNFLHVALVYTGSRLLVAGEVLNTDDVLIHLMDIWSATTVDGFLNGVYGDLFSHLEGGPTRMGQLSNL